jgi:hypothetical protein
LRVVRLREGCSIRAAGLVLIVFHDSKLHRSGGAGARPLSGDVHPSPRGGEAPTSAGAERRTRWPPCGWACPFSGRERPAHNADRHAFRRFTAAFSFVLGTAFWKRTGAAIRNALDSAGFHPRSSAPTSPLPDGPM